MLPEVVMRLAFLLLVSLLLGGAIVWPAHAQMREGFESPSPAWSLRGADGGVRVLSQKRVFDVAHTGIGSEHLRFIAGQGTHIYFAFATERAPIVEESAYSIWLKGDKARFQLMVRVVLPRTLDDRTGKPLTTLLRGDEYTETGSWQELHLKELPRLLARDLIVLRRQFGPHVDPREAFVDTVVLNVYGGPGETNLWIDDLEINGAVDPEWAKNTIGRGASDDGENLPALTGEQVARTEGNLFLLQGRPFFPRAVEERGESWELLKALGFNTLWLAAAPSVDQLAEAKRLQLWLIAPPPDTRENPLAIARADQVICWMLGRNLGAADLNPLRSLAREVRGVDRQLRRPLICGATSELWNMSQEVDMLRYEVPSLYSATDFSSATAHVRRLSQQTRTGIPYFVALRLGPSPDLFEQMRLFDPAIEAPAPASYGQSRLAIFAALRTGARGIIFRSAGRLDGDSPEAEQRRQVYRLLNQELELLEPWLAGGTVPQDVPTGDPSLKATLWQTERARLLLLSRQAPYEQFAFVPPADDTMHLILPGVPSSDRIFHLTSDGLRQLTGPVGGSGAKLVIPEAGATAAVAITQNSQVIQHLARLSEQQRRPAVETRLQMVSNQVTQTALVVEQTRPSLAGPPATNFILGDSQNLLREADRLIARGDYTGAFRHVLRAENRLATVQRQWWDTARAAFPNTLAHPLLTSFNTLPNFFQAQARLQNVTWSAPAPLAGDFERLDQLLAAGWRQQRLESATNTSLVEISPTQPHSGGHCLRLANSAASGGAESLSDAPSITITSGPINVRQGQLVAVRGWTRIPPGTSAELILGDQWSGPDLREVLGATAQWREFVVVRAAPQEGPYQISLALRGVGEIFIDDLTISLATPAATQR